MNRHPRAYPSWFRSHAVVTSQASRLPVSQFAAHLGISPSTLYRWRREDRPHSGWNQLQLPIRPTQDTLEILQDTAALIDLPKMRYPSRLITESPSAEDRAA